MAKRRKGFLRKIWTIEREWNELMQSFEFNSNICKIIHEKKKRSWFVKIFILYKDQQDKEVC